MYEILKRITDILAAGFVSLIFSPLIVLVAIAIKFDSSGPIVYKAKRVGKNGKGFEMWKFRSMVDDADDFLLKHPKYMKVFKQKEGWKFDEAGEDPRITRVGRFIRKYSVDELPNLFNIFVGDMSIVGPRAYRRDAVGDEIAEQLKLYPDLKEELKVALSVKPGLTGPWQTGGRNKLSWDQRVRLDAAYARQKNIFKDFLYVLKTPFVMLNKW
jgi:lipopolysaccharide/colanic/teichoic acid biosynthesis glycosyltransferase